jgi:MFS superfamily sulfate permease-like transporter
MAHDVKEFNNGTTESPVGNAAGFVKYLRQDLLSGFLVFLIALPLCLAISLACGYPAIAGVFTAIVGGLLAPWLSNSELTIKGPAAGLIVIALGTVTDFRAIVGDTPDAATQAYRMALAVGVAAGVLQILFAVFRTGILGDFFPTSTVHGMLAAIGLIIIAKQVPICLGLPNKGEPLELLLKIPDELMHMNPEIALIGAVSLAILFLMPLVKNRWVRMIPAQMVVVLVAVPMAHYFDLDHEHTYSLAGHKFSLGPEFLVNVPSNLFGAITLPDFSGLQHPTAWKWVIMFALIGTLESMLSAKAIDSLDPWRRKTDLDRDNLAVGVGNTLAAMIGGLPMISEIVRSKANIDNGARTRFANMFHGLFLLLFVALVPSLLHRIPLAALGAMLVYTGSRLASPREFINVYRIGREQLVIFLSTLIAVLATDLLVGILIGIAVKAGLHVFNGVPLQNLFRPQVEIEEGDDQAPVRILAKQSVVFSNWIAFKRTIENFGLLDSRNVVVDLSEARLVDHSVMEKLHELQLEFEQHGLELEIVGLDAHRTSSSHPMAARRRRLIPIRRLTVVAEPGLEKRLARSFAELGATGYTVMTCSGAGRRGLERDPAHAEGRIRFEILALPDAAERMLNFLHREIAPSFPITASIETVEVLTPEEFEPSTAASSAANT